MAKRKNHPISLKEAKEAIFLDFEGRGKATRNSPDPPPVIAGVLCEEEYSWTLLDPAFSDAAMHHGCETLLLPAFLKSLIDSGRRIVYWTSHEEKVFEKHGFPPEKQGFDLKIPVRPHFKALFKASREARNTYKSLRGAKQKKAIQIAFGLCVQCATRHGLTYSTSYGKGKIGGWINYAAKHGGIPKDSYEAWTKSAKTKWTKIIEHNRKDCEAMKLLLQHYGITH